MKLSKMCRLILSWRIEYVSTKLPKHVIDDSHVKNIETTLMDEYLFIFNDQK
jgi:hypothetical protein